MKISKPMRKKLYASFIALYLSGTVYWISHTLLRRTGEFGLEPHPIGKWVGPLHLASALVLIFIWGQIWIVHARPSSRLTESNRKTGWMILCIPTLLALSSMVLLYGSQNMIDVMRWVHPIIGQLMLVALVCHVLGATRSLKD